MTGRSSGSLRLSRHALGPRHARLMLGFETYSRRVPGLGFLFDATLRFPRRLIFCCHARQRRGFRNLFGTKLLVSQVGRAPLGLGALAGEPGEFFLFVGPCGGRNGKLRRGKFTALGVRQRTLFRLDSRAQRDFGHAFDMGLLRGGCLGGSLGGGAADGMFCSKAVGLNPALRRSRLLGGLRQPQLGGGTGPLFSTGARQCVGFGRALGIRRIRGSEIAARHKIPPLPLYVLQSLQQFAHARPQAPDTFLTAGRGSLTQTRHRPKVE